MLYSLRAIALLMLAAGISLGVFAGTLLAERSTEPGPVLDRQIEERVKLYREMYQLDAERTEQVRGELERHRTKLRELLLRLRREHEQEFSALVQDAETRIRTLLEPPVR